MKKLAILTAVLLLTGVAAGVSGGPGDDAGISDEADNQAGPSNQSAVKADGGLSGLLTGKNASPEAVEALNSVDKFLAGLFG